LNWLEKGVSFWRWTSWLCTQSPDSEELITEWYFYHLKHHRWRNHNHIILSMEWQIFKCSSINEG
jgi:hypothetical protein